MSEEEFMIAKKIITDLGNHGDINYLQTLVFDWREKSQALSRKCASWGIAAFISWTVTVIVFCVMGWMSDKKMASVQFLLFIWFLFLGVSIVLTAKRGEYSKPYKRYRELISEAQAKIKVL